jgi:hypothetical protein
VDTLGWTAEQEALYNTRHYRRFSALARDCNPICQVIENGVQCRYGSQIAHHLISPKEDKSLFLTPLNIVCVCRRHHPDTPGEMLGYLYVPTRWIGGQVFEHTGDKQIVGAKTPHVIIVDGVGIIQSN